jgi:hypothetical protein
MIFVGKPQHKPECSQELKVVIARKYHGETWFLEEALDVLCKLISVWRDGCICVINTPECRGGSQWAHVVPQGKSSYLKHELGNSFRNCEGHNNLHRFVQTPYLKWFKETFGTAAWIALDQARIDHPTYKWTAEEMRERLTKYNFLFGNRFAHAGDTLPELVASGYYGEIIEAVWIKEGRI